MSARLQGSSIGFRRPACAIMLIGLFGALALLNFGLPVLDPDYDATAIMVTPRTPVLMHGNAVATTPR